MADEDTLRLSSTPSSRSSLSSRGSAEDGVQHLPPTIDLTSRPLTPSSSSHYLRKVSPSSLAVSSGSGFQCKLCTLVASSQSALDEHMNIHTGSRPYQCLECGFSCSLQSTLTQHLAVHRVEMSSAVLMRSPSMEDQMQKSPRDHPPSLYPEVPRTLAISNTGPPMLHSDELIPVPAVPGAVGLYSDQSRLFQCKLCTHISPTKTHLNEHMNIHSGKKPYKCLVCGFSSAFRSSLMRHLIVHTGTSKQFKCDQCHYQTPYKCNLQAHRRKRHNSVGDSEIPETTNSNQLPAEVAKVHTPNSNHSDDSQSGMGVYPPSDMSSIGFPYSQGAVMGVNDRESLSTNGPSEEHHIQEAQETSTSGTTDPEIMAGKENGYSSAPEGQLMVSVDETSATKHGGSNGGSSNGGGGSSPGSGSGPSQEQSGGYLTEHHHHSRASFSPPTSTENGDAVAMAPDSAGSAMLIGEPPSTSVSPIASLSQMATSHSPLTSESIPATSMWPSSGGAGFPIFTKKKKEGGAKKRKRPPIPKRDLLMSPEQEMWVDTRSDSGRMMADQRPYFINLPGVPNQLKPDDDHGMGYPDQNGLDLSSTIAAREGSRREAMLNNHNSPPGAPVLSTITQEDTIEDKNHGYPFHHLYPNQAAGVQMGAAAGGKVPHQQVSTGTQTDQPPTKADGGKFGDVIPPQAHKCPHCETYFTDQVMFTLHMSCHGRIHPFQCGICGYMCGDKIEFTCHITRSKHLR